METPTMMVERPINMKSGTGWVPDRQPVILLVTAGVGATEPSDLSKRQSTATAGVVIIVRHDAMDAGVFLAHEWREYGFAVVVVFHDPNLAHTGLRVHGVRPAARAFRQYFDPASDAQAMRMIACLPLEFASVDDVVESEVVAGILNGLVLLHSHAMN